MRLPAFLALSVTTVAAVIVAGVLVASQPRASTSAGAGEALFPTLTAEANKIASIRIQRGGETTTIVQGEHGWVIKERGDYPASLEKVRQVVVALAQLRRVEAKTDRPDHYASIGVENSGPGTESTEVSILDSEGKPLAELLVGKAPASGGMTDAHFVRVPDEQRAWLAAGPIEVDPAVATWVDPTVVNLPSAAMAEVQITRPDGKKLTFVKADPDTPHFSLREMPRNHRIKQENSADSTAIVLTELQLQDLKLADQVAFPADGTTHAQFRTFDGLIVDLDLVEKDGKDWIRLTPTTKPGASPDAVAEAAALAERTRGYVFSVYSWKVAPLKRTLEDLTEAASGS